MDNDGDVDVIANSDRSTGRLFCFLNDGSQNFTTHATDRWSGGVGSIALIDLGGDAGPAVLASVANQLAYYLNLLPQGPKANAHRDWMLYR
ncbi:hypothetical protein IIC65_08380 [Candidatus Sumerlaeota bacterium]|nr:hypothetical protein [Candidatus Sumerlaeota bacterium]